jgi:protoheme IX farnesyltransferase
MAAGSHHAIVPSGRVPDVRLSHAGATHGPRTKVGAFIALTKPRIIELLLVTTIPTMILADQGLPSIGLMAATLVGGALAAGGANAINMYVDRDIDRLMPRTQHRPLVTGMVSPWAALVFAVLLEAAAVAELWLLVNPLSALLALSATLFYVFVYTLWLKRTSTQNIVIGGAAGAVPVLVGWSAVTDSLAWPPVVLFVIVFLWTPPHFWSLAIRYAEDYRMAQVPMLPAVESMDVTSRKMLRYTVALWIASLVLVPVADTGWIYGVTAFVLGAFYVVSVLGLRRYPSPRRAMRLFRYSITYTTLLFAALAVDTLVRH